MVRITASLLNGSERKRKVHFLYSQIYCQQSSTRGTKNRTIFAADFQHRILIMLSRSHRIQTPLWNGVKRGKRCNGLSVYGGHHCFYKMRGSYEL